MEILIILTCLLLLLVYAGIIIWTAIWGYKDAESRGTSGLLLVLIILLTWPIGLIVWFFVRPEKLEMQRLAEKYGDAK